MRVKPMTLALATLMLCASCKTRSYAAGIEEFSQPKVIKVDEVPMRLSRATSIPHRMVRKTVESGKYFFDSDFFEAEFPPISESQFNILMQTYGTWSHSKSRVTYHPEKSWNLADFLPPAMQAALEMSFLSETTQRKLPRVFGDHADGSRVDTPVTLLSNCWGTAFEVVRAAGSTSESNALVLFYAPQRTAREVFLDPQWSTEIHPYAKRTFPDASERNANLQPGDVLLVGGSWLQHVAIFVDDDLYFEKAGSGNTALYRISDWTTLSKTWPPDLHGYSWRRFNRKPLPDPSDLFNLRTSMPLEISLDAFTVEEIRTLTAEINRDDQTGKPLGATWLERRDVPFTFQPNGRARVLAP